MSKRLSDIYLSIIIPAFNEADRIEATLDRLTTYLDKQPYKSEVLVIVDGSTDQSISRVSRSALWRQYIQLLDNRVNRGKGYAVRHGMLTARGQYLLSCDADLSTPIEQVARLLKALDEGYDVAIGSRRLRESEIKVPQPWWRVSMGRVFNRLVQALLLKGIQDSQCGFKCFKRDVALAIFPRQRIEEFCFDVEVLWIARKLGYKIAEVPVVWIRQPVKGRSLAEALRMLVDLFRIRLNDRRGVYITPDESVSERAETRI
jgi:dolichyl-phosphate beta-glucosyltransferase